MSAARVARDEIKPCSDVTTITMMLVGERCLSSSRRLKGTQAMAIELIEKAEAKSLEVKIIGKLSTEDYETLECD